MCMCVRACVRACVFTDPAGGCRYMTDRHGRRRCASSEPRSFHSTAPWTSARSCGPQGSLHNSRWRSSGRAPPSLQGGEDRRLHANKTTKKKQQQQMDDHTFPFAHTEWKHLTLRPHTEWRHLTLRSLRLSYPGNSEGLPSPHSSPAPSCSPSGSRPLEAWRKGTHGGRQWILALSSVHHVVVVFWSTSISTYSSFWLGFFLQ